jgi:hypothetical protein
MARRVSFALPVVALVLACSGGGSDDPPGPPQVACGSTATAGPLAVNAAPTCGSVTYPGYHRYTFTAPTAGRYTVTLWTTSGDVDLFVSVLGLNYSSLNSPPEWVDSVSFDVGFAGVIPEMVVNAFDANSTYAIQVTRP